MISGIFKGLSYKLLCNNLSGSVIRALWKDSIPDLRWRNYYFDITATGMRNSIVASIFWGFYEAAEIRFVEKYFKGDTDVLELGASSGIVSAHIISKLSGDRRLISVEANKALETAWLKNTRRHNHGNAKGVLLNYAIHYDHDHVTFNISDNTTESKVASDQSGDAVIKVPARTLGSLLSEFHVTRYSLFCDIEGAEIQILENDSEAFSNCKSMLVELHSVMYKNVLYTIGDLKERIVNLGFRPIERHGNVFYFEK